MRAVDVTGLHSTVTLKGQKCLEDRASLDGKKERSVDVQTLEWLDKFKLLCMRRPLPGFAKPAASRSCVLKALQDAYRAVRHFLATV